MKFVAAVWVSLCLYSPAWAQVYEAKYGEGEYSYDVSGYDSEGNYVSGNVDTDDKFVEGYVINEEGEEVYFEGEFVDQGEIEGYDENGNWVELEVD